jgi:hypothetical protein
MRGMILLLENHKLRLMVRIARRYLHGYIRKIFKSLAWVKREGPFSMILNYVLDPDSAFHRNGKLARSIPIIRMTKEGVGTRGEN